MLNSNRPSVTRIEIVLIECVSEFHRLMNHRNWLAALRRLPVVCFSADCHFMMSNTIGSMLSVPSYQGSSKVKMSAKSDS